MFHVKHFMLFLDILIVPKTENVSRETFSAISQKINFSPNMPNLAQSVSRETLCARF
jgi:hypothetical protein